MGSGKTNWEEGVSLWWQVPEGLLKNALSLALWKEAAMVGKGEGNLASPAVLMGRKVLAWVWVGQW